MTGILGGKWALENFQPKVDLPTAVKLTSYSGDASNLSVEQLIQAHELMDANQAGGKIVILGKE